MLEKLVSFGGTENYRQFERDPGARKSAFRPRQFQRHVIENLAADTKQFTDSGEY